MDQPRLLGMDGQPLAAISTLAELTKDQRIALQKGDAGPLFSQSAAGKPVTMTTAMQLSTVWACVSRTAMAIASMPLDVFGKTSTGRVKEEGWLADLINLSPNGDQTPVEYWEGMVSWLVATGNAYSEIYRVGGRPAALLPLPSGRVTPIRIRSTGDLGYELLDWDNRKRVIARDDMFHLRGWGFGGDEGLSAIRFGIQALGSALAADEASGKMFGSGMQASGVLKVGQKLNDIQRAQLRSQMEAYAGSNRAGKLMVLESGMEFSSLSLNPDDAQMLETRRFSVEEICRWFGVPPIVIGHAAQGQTMWGSGVEQIFIAWMQMGLNPIAKRIEQRIRKQLIPARDQRRLYAEFNREAMMQMDTAAKSAFLREMVSNGIMDRDEARAKLNMEARGGAAAMLMAQSAMAPIDKLDNQES